LPLALLFLQSFQSSFHAAENGDLCMSVCI
jgi:hypothetical protein